jgi:anti-anti-sigma factor
VTQRASGARDTPIGLSLGDHLCWSYTDDADYSDNVAEYLLEGLGAGERLAYLADASTDEDLLADLTGVADAEDLATRGDLLLVPIRQAYAPDGWLDASQRIDGYRAAADQALAAGYTGLRIAANATAIAADPVLRDDFVRYEHLVDRMISSEPLLALCAYDERLVDARTLTGLLGTHPLHRRDTDVDLAVFAAADGTTTVVAGEVDLATIDLLHLALDQLVAAGGSGDVVLDLEPLGFIDGAGMGAIALAAERLAEQGRRLVLGGTRPVLERCWSILGYERLANVEIRTLVRA